jgi:Sulfotransferase family
MIDDATRRKAAADLDPDRLMQAAEDATGLSDYGNRFFIEPLTDQLRRAAREVDFTEAGLQQQKADTLRYLINRLRTQEDIRRHPDILDEDVSDPIIIIGLPRSGTTKTQRMMSAAPEVQKLYAWRIMNPARFPNVRPGQPDPRLEAGGDDFLSGKRQSILGAGHEMGAQLVDSDIALFEQSFDLHVLGLTPRLPLFALDQWAPGVADTRGDREAYAYLRTLLKYLQWQDGGKRHRPWILKSIIHHAHMDTALQTFPRATFIHTQRDPRDSVASFAKLQYAAFNTRSRNIDKHWMGQRVLDYCALGMARYMDARDRLKLDDRIVDLKYEDVRTHILPAIRDAYRRAGRTLSGAAEQAMQQWEQDNEQHKLGRHSYSLEEFGLSNQQIDRAFAPFIERFIRRKQPYSVVAI